MMEVTKVWWDGNKIMAEPVDPASVYSDIVSDGGPDPRNKFDKPAQQEPMDFDSLFHEAEEIVRQKPTWKRFIDGTPLSNDIAVWMTVFAQDVARRTSPQRTWVGLTNNELQPIADEYRILFGSWVEDFARAIEAKLKEKNT